jgi:hypothetical protein
MSLERQRGEVPHDRSNKNQYCAGGSQQSLEVLMTETTAATEGVDYA